MCGAARPIWCCGRSASATPFPNQPAGSMLVLVLAVFAQSQISVTIGSQKKDRGDKAKQDSIAYARDLRRDSLRVRRQQHDSLERQARVARQLPLTPKVLATAYKDPVARDVLQRARTARLVQDSTLTGYESNGYERLSVGMGFKRIGRDRLLLRGERASHVVWRRGRGAIVDVTGQRAVFPMIEGINDGDPDLNMSGEMADIPYAPGRETLWIGGGLARARIDEDEMIHPLAEGAEAYYTYQSGDSVAFQLPGGKRIELRELRVRPRQPKWNVGVGSLWFDMASAHLVRAVYRMAQEMDIMAVAKEESEDTHDPDDDIPRWLKPVMTPMKANISAVTVEY